jgi:hypothetical protein
MSSSASYGLVLVTARHSGRRLWPLVAESTWLPPDRLVPGAQSYRLCHRTFGCEGRLNLGSKGRFRSGPIQSIRLRLFAPSADACCSGGRGVGQEPASRALAWLPSRGAWRRAHRDFMDFFGGEHHTTVGQRFRHWDSLRLEGDGAEGVHSSLSGIAQLQAAIHIPLGIIFGPRSTNRST